MDRVDQWIEPDFVYDAHCHYFGYSTLERFAKERGFDSVDKWADEWSFKNMSIQVPPRDPHSLADVWAEELRSKGCTKAVLFPEFNKIDEMKVAVEDYPDLFIPYMMLNPIDDSLDSMKLLEDARSKTGIKGFKLYPPLHYYHAYDDRLLPFYEYAQDHDLNITFHFGISVGQQADIRYMDPSDLSPIARDYPKINFLMAHFATGYLRELLFLMYHLDNVYAETSSSNAWMKYLPYDITLHDVFQKVIDVKGYKQLVFGTDSSFLPRGWRQAIYKGQLAVCNHLGLDKEAIDGIFWQNLANLFEL